MLICGDCGFSGRWHGDVLIHTYDNQTEAEVLEFLRDVANLSRIRHESICLFMGASLQSPNYAIVTRSDLLQFYQPFRIGRWFTRQVKVKVKK